MTDVIADFEPPPRQWECPNCTVMVVTPASVPNRYHDCVGLAGLTAPMVPVGSGAQVIATEREDYVGREDVLYDGNGRPIMSVTVNRPDGSNDAVIYVPTARGYGS